MLTVSNDASTATVTLAQQEVYLLRNLLGLSIPTLTGWQYQLTPSTFDPAVNLAAAARPREDYEDDGAATSAPTFAAKSAPPAPAATAYPMRR